MKAVLEHVGVSLRLCIKKLQDLAIVFPYI
jgi:hypothetical protein